MILSDKAYSAINKSVEANYKSVIRLCKNYINPTKNIRVLDLGCGDGALLKEVFNSLKLGCKQGHGVEIFEPRADETRKKGFNVKSFDLNSKFQYKDNYFDYIIANQIIEHVYFTDSFMEEAHRILKPGGIILLSSTNLAALHNRFFLLLGYQPNCLHPARKIVGTMMARKGANPMHGHKSVFTGKALREFVKSFGFKILYYETETIPLAPSFVSRALCRFFDFGTHVTIVAKKG